MDGSVVDANVEPAAFAGDHRDEGRDGHCQTGQDHPLPAGHTSRLDRAAHSARPPPSAASNTCSTVGGYPSGSTTIASTEQMTADMWRILPSGADAASGIKPHSRYQGRN